MWFALLLVVCLTFCWITGSFGGFVIAGVLAVLIVRYDAGWAVSALIALGCIASLAGWLDRPQRVARRAHSHQSSFAN